ncbi:MAG: FHA domain-containing protein [Polyangiaceae bacterium]
MGILACRSDGVRRTLGEHCLIGRGPHCALRLDNPLVSSEHARLRYRDGGWVVRDLGSSNGTMVDDRPLKPGRDYPIKLGSMLRFGSRSNAWELVDERAPGLRAVALDGGALIVAEGEILTLPEGEDPECQIFAGPGEGWRLERRGDSEAVEDQQIVTLITGAYRLELPPRREGVETTFEDDRPSGQLMESVTLRFSVSRDGDDVSLQLVAGAWSMDLGIRAFNDVLLSLARQRLDDMRDAQLEHTEHGWVYTDEIIARVGLRDEAQLNQYVFHARRQLARAGVEGAARLVDRGRPGRLRLGTGRVEIVSG